MAPSIIAVNTRRIMEQRGVKHKAVAARAGFTDKQFSALMPGRRTVRDVDVIAIAEALDVTPNELFAKVEDAG